MFAFLRLADYPGLTVRSVAMRPLDRFEIMGDYTLMYISIPKESTDETQILDVLAGVKKLSLAFTIYEGRAYLYDNANTLMSSVTGVLQQSKELDSALSKLTEATSNFTLNNSFWIYFRTTDVPISPPYSSANTIAFWEGALENYTIALDVSNNARKAIVNMRFVAGKSKF